MVGRPVRVLMVEDDEDDFLLTREHLAEIPGGRFDLDRAATFQAGLDAIARNEHDVYLLDYRLDGHDGLELLREAIRRGCRAPLILMTGVGDQEVDLEAMRAGAADYLVKDQINGPTLERSIRYAEDVLLEVLGKREVANASSLQLIPGEPREVHRHLRGRAVHEEKAQLGVL